MQANILRTRNSELLPSSDHPGSNDASVRDLATGIPSPTQAPGEVSSDVEVEDPEDADQGPSVCARGIIVCR